MPESVQMLLVGSAGLTAGVLFIIFRTAIARFFADQLSGFERMGISTARRSTASRTAFTGAVAIFIGTVLIVVSFTR